jgi:hypothetical protein
VGHHCPLLVSRRRPCPPPEQSYIQRAGHVHSLTLPTLPTTPLVPLSSRPRPSLEAIPGVDGRGQISRRFKLIYIRALTSG